MDNSGDYTVVLPAIVVIAIGMSMAVAPLTTAVLASVDSDHTGSASGFNSAVARIGGLVATALLGSVLTAKEPGFLDEVHDAAISGAAIAAAAGLSALAFFGRSPSRAPT
jgi:predicted MFS family arabinose efflux permease